MRRRDLIKAIAGWAAARPLVARAQQSLPLIAFMSSRSSRLSGATTIRPTPTWWSLVTAFSLIYRELPANYGIRTTSPLALNKNGLGYSLD
jgi:hypothetical protein